MTHELYTQLINSPSAPILVDKLKDALEVEQVVRKEFHKQLDQIDYKCEFINGQKILHSPVTKYHNEFALLLGQLMNVYVISNNLGFVGYEKIMISLTRNDYEPDLCFFKTEKAKLFTDKQLRFPAPDLAVEILSESSQKRDRVIKFEDYQNHNVLEYWMIVPETKTIEQYILVDEIYELKLNSSDGFIESLAVEGFKIPIQAIFDKKTNLQVITDLLQTS